MDPACGIPQSELHGGEIKYLTYLQTVAKRTECEQYPKCLTYLWLCRGTARLSSSIPLILCPGTNDNKCSDTRFLLFLFFQECPIL